MTAFQLLIGFSTGLVIGTAIATHALSRAVVIGLLAGAVLGDIMIDGVEGYLNWAASIPLEMAKFTGFWSALIAGLAGSIAVAWLARSPPAH
jgi:hypothetical protein